MDRLIKERIINEANYIINTGKTVREMSNIFNISKSTIHKDLHERLLKIDIDLYNKVKDIFNYHINIRHINGGNATRIKYLNSK